jgi:hypothetical protein
MFRKKFNVFEIEQRQQITGDSRSQNYPGSPHPRSHQQAENIADRNGKEQYERVFRFAPCIKDDAEDQQYGIAKPGESAIHQKQQRQKIKKKYYGTEYHDCPLRNSPENL